jgi:hypothetical protein
MSVREISVLNGSHFQSRLLAKKKNSKAEINDHLGYIYMVETFNNKKKKKLFSFISILTLEGWRDRDN